MFYICVHCAVNIMNTAIKKRKIYRTPTKKYVEKFCCKFSWYINFDIHAACTHEHFSL